VQLKKMLKTILQLHRKVDVPAITDGEKVSEELWKSAGLSGDIWQSGRAYKL